MADTAGQWHALTGCYGRHRRPALWSHGSGAALTLAIRLRLQLPGPRWPWSRRLTSAGSASCTVVLASVTVALIGCYGRLRRPAARSNWLLWPTPQGGRRRRKSACGGFVLRSGISLHRGPHIETRVARSHFVCVARVCVCAWRVCAREGQRAGAL